MVGKGACLGRGTVPRRGVFMASRCASKRSGRGFPQPLSQKRRRGYESLVGWVGCSWKSIRRLETEFRAAVVDLISKISFVLKNLFSWYIIAPIDRSGNWAPSVVVSVGRLTSRLGSIPGGG